MKTVEVREMSVEDLKAREIELVEQIFRGRFKKSLGDTDAIKQIRFQKKELARIKTVLRERDLGLER
jgi:large subunit ribosomal protein L29